MTQSDAEELLAKGLEALSHNHTHLAMTCLEQAARYDRNSIVLSHLAYCLAVNGRDIGLAIDMASEALAQEPYNPVFCLNLGRIYLLAGKRGDAIRTFRQGLAFIKDQAIIDELEKLGTRKKPVFPGLHRDHVLNRYLGLLLNRLGLR